MSESASQARPRGLPVPRWVGGWPPLALPAVVTALTLLAIRTGTESDARDPDLLGYAFAPILGAALLLRWRSPVAVPVIVVVAGGTYHALNYPGGAPMFAMGAALYIAAEAGHRNIALLVGGISAGIALAYRSIAEGHSFLEMSMIAEPALVIAAVMLGDAIHSRRRWMAEVQERLDRAEEEREEEARRRVDQERLRIAHELHDVLAHTIAVVNVQAGVASDLLDDDPTATRAALSEIRKASREAMTELRATVGLLRDSSPAPRGPVPGLRDLARVTDAARQAGIGRGHGGGGRAAGPAGAG
ncbi:MAG: sensor histidine kinase [Dehalococcoidia bacterium]|nr:sensor histidine kinase [Dehalococcoidia bacterium]